MPTLPVFADARVLVIGDVMLDRYWYGDTGRISPEAPVPVVRIGEEERRLGGGANVALNLARIGARTRLIGVVGDDEPGRAADGLLQEAGVVSDLLISNTHPTIAKLRVMSRNQQLIRLDFEKSFAMDGAFERAELLARVRAALADTDVIVCSDYGKGTLADVAAIIAMANAAGVAVLIDPKGRDWARYAGASLITPNVAEFAAYAESFATAGDWQDDTALARGADYTLSQLDLAALLITRSEKGMSLFERDDAHHLPARAREVFDVTGAGDTVIAMMAAGLAAGLTRAQAAELANLAAGIVVAKLGTAAVSRDELLAALHAAPEGGRGVTDEAALADWMTGAKARGERGVMTNGCFDLLHPGHVAYLEAARALGDHLIVAVNDDASVARLKGSARPINPLAHRMQVLRGLGAVDWVVAFGEDTPERLICRLLPDVLVKGGDYDAARVAGADCVTAAGGEVRILEFVDGHSTSAIAARIRERGSD